MDIRAVLEKILPRDIMRCLDGAGVELNEIRLRAEQPLAVRSGLKSYFVGRGGAIGLDAAALTARAQDSYGKGKPFERAYIVGEAEIEEIFFNACSRSVYAYGSEIRRGSITLEGGVRVGLCGAAVIENGEVVTQKDINGVNIRIPREVRGCAAEIISALKGKAAGTLIIAPVYSGKTTVLRDIAANLYTRFGVTSALLVDERNEIAACHGGKPAFNLPCVDILSGYPKTAAVENVIRAMSPEAIITDEIFERELSVLKTVANCGAAVFASAHAASLKQAVNRFGAENLKMIFSRYFVLANKGGIGKLTAAYGEGFEELPF